MQIAKKQLIEHLVDQQMQKIQKMFSNIIAQNITKISSSLIQYGVIMNPQEYQCISHMQSLQNSTLISLDVLQSFLYLNIFQQNAIINFRKSLSDHQNKKIKQIDQIKQKIKRLGRDKCKLEMKERQRQFQELIKNQEIQQDYFSKEELPGLESAQMAKLERQVSFMRKRYLKYQQRTKHKKQINPEENGNGNQSDRNKI